MSHTDDFWLVSVPGEKTPQESWERLYKTISPLANIFKINIPGLKVGTLDQLFGLSDELNKMDTFVESLVTFFFKVLLCQKMFSQFKFSPLFSRVTRKVAQYLSEVLEHEKDKLAENLMANNGKLFPQLESVSSKKTLIEYHFFQSIVSPT
jgi:V-type H+-transporting ATPase subunit C